MNTTKPQSNCSGGNLSQCGFTLVELMIAMTIGLFLSAGIISLLIGTRQSYRVTQGMAEVQENGRFAIEYLARNIRHAGFREYDATATPPAFSKIPSPIINGWEGAASDPSTESLTTYYYPQTDILRIRYRHFFSSEISYGRREDLFYIGKMSAGGEPGLRLKQTGRVPDPNPTQVYNFHEELLEGVYDMQVRYRSNSGYINANPSWTNADWEQVIAVRIDLLIGSREENLVGASMTLPFPFNGHDTSDRRFYQTFTTTIALRNRLP